MKRIITFIMAGLLLGCAHTGPTAVGTGPEADRIAMIDHYKQILPNIKFEDYIYGALAMNPDAKSQYESIMEFPSYSIDLDRGKNLWEAQFNNGKRFSSCFPNGGKNIAGNYPYFDNASNRVVTFENAINNCLKANGEKELKYGDKDMGLLTAYARSLSDGMKVNVKVESAAALAAYEKGKAYYHTRNGQLNFACANCHVDNAGNVRAKPKDANSEEYNDLEYYLTYMSNGLPMQTPVFRK
jgi:sulfur-oxidizing protein SoxA